MKEFRNVHLRMFGDKKETQKETIIKKPPSVPQKSVVHFNKASSLEQSEPKQRSDTPPPKLFPNLPVLKPVSQRILHPKVAPPPPVSEQIKPGLSGNKWKSASLMTINTNVNTNTTCQTKDVKTQISGSKVANFKVLCTTAKFETPSFQEARKSPVAPDLTTSSPKVMETVRILETKKINSSTYRLSKAASCMDVHEKKETSIIMIPRVKGIRMLSNRFGGLPQHQLRRPSQIMQRISLFE